MKVGLYYLNFITMLPSSVSQVSLQTPPWSCPEKENRNCIQFFLLSNEISKNEISALETRKGKIYGKGTLIKLCKYTFTLGSGPSIRILEKLI